MPAPPPPPKWYARLSYHYLALAWLGLLGVVVVLAPLLANPLPYRAVVGGQVWYPAWQPAARGSFWDPTVNRVRDMACREVAWYAQDASSLWWAPVRYDGRALGKDELLPPGAASRLSPNRGTHWLGTTKGGTDILGGLIRGSRLSLGVGLLAVTLALALGLLMGSLAGYFQDHRFQPRLGRLLAWGLGLLLAWYYGWDRQWFALEAAQEHGHLAGALAWNVLLSGLILLAAHRGGGWLAQRGRLARRVSFPLDTLIMRGIEVLDSLPRLLLLLAIAAIFKDRGLVLVAVLLGLTGWTGLARLVRGELLRIQQLDFVQAASALGLPHYRILWRHTLPHALAPVYIWVAISLGGAMVAESALSFLGLVEHSSSWGALLSDAKNHFAAWWIALFPGLCLFATVLAFNILGEWLRDRQDPRQLPPAKGLTARRSAL